MTWLAIVLYIVSNIPTLIGVIQKILDLIHGLPKAQADSIKHLLSQAVEQHKQTKDDAALTKVCEGVGCPPGLVG